MAERVWLACPETVKWCCRVVGADCRCQAPYTSPCCPWPRLFDPFSPAVAAPSPLVHPFHLVLQIWYCVSPKDSAKFDTMARGLFPQAAAACPAFVRHKDVMVSPRVLRSYSVPFVQVSARRLSAASRACGNSGRRCLARAPGALPPPGAQAPACPTSPEQSTCSLAFFPACPQARQEPGEFIVLNAAAYHSGFNLGFNVAGAGPSPRASTWGSTSQVRALALLPCWRARGWQACRGAAAACPAGSALSPPPRGAFPRRLFRLRLLAEHSLSLLPPPVCLPCLPACPQRR